MRRLAALAGLMLTGGACAGAPAAGPARISRPAAAAPAGVGHSATPGYAVGRP